MSIIKYFLFIFVFLMLAGESKAEKVKKKTQQLLKKS